MARGVNKVILVGRLGQDPEVRYTTSGSAVTNASVATTESWKDKATGERVDKTEWHRVVFFGRLAEIAGEYLRKGSQVYIEGRIQTRKWQDQNNQDRYTTEIVANDLQMLGSAQGTGGQSNYGQAPTAPRTQDHSQQQASNVTQGNFNQQNQQQTPQNQQTPAQNQPNFDDFDDDIPF